jgi:UDP-glucose 4-epimerase
MRLEFLHRSAATDDVIYKNAASLLKFRIGDVRDHSSLLATVKGSDIVFHAAALKQVPSCEYFPFEAVMTNVVGAQNLVRCIRENGVNVEKVIGISTDKACKPINVMGMTKALQERILIEANRDNPNTSFMCVRYGNVIASRGSIIPLFVDQITNNRPITVTLPEMTRFLLSLNRAVDTVFAALERGNPGETFVPKVSAAKIIDVAHALLGNKQLPIEFTGIRPGEKLHEIMVSEEECFRTVECGDSFVIEPVLPELRTAHEGENRLETEYSSKDNTLSVDQLRKLLGSANDEIGRFLTANG